MNNLHPQWARIVPVCVLLAFLVLLMFWVGCGDKAPRGPVENPLVIRYVRFDGPLWNEARKTAVLVGMNESEGSHRYRTRFEEGPHNPLQIIFYSRLIETDIVGGMVVHGFYNLNTMGISDTFQNDLKTIRDISRHEADHVHGRRHITRDEFRKLQKQFGRVPEAMTWQDWPDAP